jgi:RHS repeat-associated protein
MQAFARTTEEDCYTRAANDECFHGGPGNRTKYAYDNANRISGITNTTNSALSWTYGYDLLDRLTSAGVSGTSFGWTYDANGNRLTQTGTDEWTLNVRSTNNQITSTTGTQARTYTYDAAGNSLTYLTNTFTYSDSDRMKTVKVGSSTTTYVINALGQRIKKSGGSAGTVLYMYDEAGHTLGEYTSTGALTEETIWLGDTPVAIIIPSGSTVAVYYVITDHLNTPKKISQPSSNKLAWRWDNDPFGIFTPNQNPQSLGTFVYNLRYPGQLYDSEAGLNYNYMRDYDPQVGRYVESDPIGLRGGSNLYAYADDMPTAHSDPSGLCPWCLVIPAVCSGGACEALITAMGLGAVLSTPAGQKAAQDTAAAATRALTCSRNDDFCHERWEQEDQRCSQWSGLGTRVVAACKARAANRRNLCVSNGGRPNPEEPPEYNPFLDYPR